MNKIVIALAALFTSALFAPAARAFDCDADDASEIADCVRGAARRVPGVPLVLPSTVRSPAAIRAQCDADDAEELKECLRDMRASSARQPAPPDARTAAEAPLEKRSPDKVVAAPVDSPVPATLPEKPVKVGGLEQASLCQKYFPSIGQMIAVPCPANKLDTADDTPLCQRYFSNVGQMVMVPCNE